MSTENLRMISICIRMQGIFLLRIRIQLPRTNSRARGNRIEIRGTKSQTFVYFITSTSIKKYKIALLKITDKSAQFIRHCVIQL